MYFYKIELHYCLTGNCVKMLLEKVEIRVLLWERDFPIYQVGWYLNLLKIVDLKKLTIKHQYYEPISTKMSPSKILAPSESSWGSKVDWGMIWFTEEAYKTRFHGNLILAKLRSIFCVNHMVSSLSVHNLWHWVWSQQHLYGCSSLQTDVWGSHRTYSI